MNKLKGVLGAVGGVALLLVATAVGNLAAKAIGDLLGARPLPETTSVSSPQDKQAVAEPKAGPRPSRTIFRDKTTGELFEQLPDGTYRRHHGKVIPYPTGNEINESFRSHLGSDLANALAAAPSAEPQAPKQETSVARALECVLDEMPGVQTDLAAQAILVRCKERYKGESVGNKSGWLARYDSPSDCVADNAKETQSEAGVRLIVAACRGLYAPG